MSRILAHHSQCRLHPRAALSLSLCSAMMHLTRRVAGRAASAALRPAARLTAAPSVASAAVAVSRRSFATPAASPVRETGTGNNRVFPPETKAGSFRRPAKMSIKFSLSDDPGALQRALEYFARHHVNMTRLESRPSKRSTEYDFYIDFLGTPEQLNVQQLLGELKANAGNLSVLESRKVPWFPRRAKELDLVANQILDAGVDLESDHPGFKDPVYRARRLELSMNAKNYRHGHSIPRIDYTQQEIDTWGQVYERLMPLVNKYGCAEHVRLLPLLQENVGYAANNIPQLGEISDFLKECTGFTIRPVAGLLSARNFLYGLAFRTFFSTQYLRHHSKPLYTPEPDLVHELMGHAPLFADQSFADFSQEIGLAAIGATDEQITKLARCYWFTVEFGLCLDADGVTRKAFGAGLLSSFGELEYAMGLGRGNGGGAGPDKPQVVDWDPFAAGEQDYPITTYQPLYYQAKSFTDAKTSMQQFSSTFARQFHVRYNPYTQALEVDGNIDLVEPVKQ